MNYEVTLKIKNKTQGGLYEFKWNNEVLRTRYEATTLLIDSESDESLLNTVLDLSEGTLEIIKFEKVDELERKAVDLMAELSQPKPNVMILRNINMAMSNN